MAKATGKEETIHHTQTHTQSTPLTCYPACVCVCARGDHRLSVGKLSEDVAGHGRQPSKNKDRPFPAVYYTSASSSSSSSSAYTKMMMMTAPGIRPLDVYPRTVKIRKIYLKNQFFFLLNCPDYFIGTDVKRERKSKLFLQKQNKEKRNYNGRITRHALKLGWMGLYTWRNPNSSSFVLRRCCSSRRCGTRRRKDYTLLLLLSRP